LLVVVDLVVLTAAVVAVVEALKLEVYQYLLAHIK
jgi:hypothetical protein